MTHEEQLTRRSQIVGRQWTDEQDRSDWFEEQARHYAALCDRAVYALADDPFDGAAVLAAPQILAVDDGIGS